VGWAEQHLQPDWAGLGWAIVLVTSIVLVGWAGRHLQPEAGTTAMGLAGLSLVLILSLSWAGFG